MHSWTTTIAMALAIATTMPMVGGCPYNLTGSWEGSCEIYEEDYLYTDPETGDVSRWDITWTFDLDFDVEDRNGRLSGDGDGEFALVLDEQVGLILKDSFSVDGEHWDNRAELTITGEGSWEGIELQLDGDVFRNVVEGDCVYQDDTDTFDNCKFLLER